MNNQIVDVARQVSAITTNKLGEIQRVAQMTKILAINARIEAARAGAAGQSFAVVADEVKAVSGTVQRVADELSHELEGRMRELDEVAADIRGSRLADLALNMIDIIDRNLYERSCDVRWWATDSAVVDACAEPDEASRRHAAGRLAVILASYTVYLDLWIVGADGSVLANARPDQYRSVVGSSVASEDWFNQALATADGTEFVACDVTRSPLLGDAQIATFAAAVREGGGENGRVIGALGIFFDWQPQAAGVVDSVRLTDDERESTRCLLLDRNGRIIASSDGSGLLETSVELNAAGPNGYYETPGGGLCAYAQTPGYETYNGMGWYGVIEQYGTARAGARMARPSGPRAA